jgi:transcriptional regulator with XRE-family HTH domain
MFQFWQQALLDKGQSVKELSYKSGVELEYVRKITNGWVLPGSDALRRLCKALGCDFYSIWQAMQMGTRVERIVYRKGPTRMMADALENIHRLEQQYTDAQKSAAHKMMNRILSDLTEGMSMEHRVELAHHATKLNEVEHKEAKRLERQKKKKRA